MRAQRLGIGTGDSATEGILHLPGAAALATAVVFDDDDLARALSTRGIAALAVTLRTPPSIATGLADAQAALRVARAHGGVPDRLALVGRAHVAAVAAIAAGRDSRVRAVALLEPRAEAEPPWKPVVELSRTRARVLLAGGDAARYAAVLLQARVSHLVRDDADAAAIAALIEEAFSPTRRE